jgi:hypothetical protein
MNKIQPEELPVMGEGFVEETGLIVSMESAAVISAERTVLQNRPLISRLREMNGKNVFVQLKNGDTVKGHLSFGDEIRVGFRETVVDLGDIDSIILT